jgi:hypothetical protein
MALAALQAPAHPRASTLYPEAPRTAARRIDIGGENVGAAFDLAHFSVGKIPTKS